MSEIIERVARAVAKENLQDPDEMVPLGPHGTGPSWKLFVDDARAAIATMREPTEAMLEAALAAGGFLPMPKELIMRHWSAMIDEALQVSRYLARPTPQHCGRITAEELDRYAALLEERARRQTVADRIQPTGTPTWYVAWTRAKIEAKAAAGLADGGFQVFLPTLAKWEKRGQRPRQRLERPLFSGYVFVGFDPLLNKSGITYALDTDGVCGILKNNDMYLKVPQGTIDRMRLCQLRGDYDATIREAERFAASLPPQGSYVRMKTGIFEGLHAFVSAVSRAKVVLTLAGSSLQVEMPAGQAVEGWEPA